MARAKQEMQKHVPPPLAQRGGSRRNDALLRVFLPLPIKRQISYIEHVLMDPFGGLVTDAMTRNERYQCYAIIFLVQTIVISFTVFRTLI
jgi:hypothetical protein